MNKKTYHIRLKVDREKDLTVVNIKGDAGIRNIAALKEKLSRIEFATNQVDIKFQKPEIIDLSTIQVIYALFKTLRAEGKKVRIISELAEEYAGLLSTTGFDKMMQL